MSEESIRTLLARLPPSSFVKTEAGFVAILRSRVIEARGDPEAVTAWVEGQGGYVDQTNPVAPRGRGPGSGSRQKGDVFYAVPREALRQS